MPVLTANYQNIALKSSLIKNYSVLKQALDLYQIDHGERLTPEVVYTEGLKNNLVKYMNVMYDCGQGSFDETACLPNMGSNDERNSKIYKNYNGSNDIELSNFDGGQFVLSDESLILCDTYGSSGSIPFISVDVNGFGKKPNRLGKDLFMFQLMENGKLLPMGANGTIYLEDYGYCSNTSTNKNNGAACTNKVLSE